MPRGFTGIHCNYLLIQQNKSPLHLFCICLHPCSLINGRYLESTHYLPSTFTRLGNHHCLEGGKAQSSLTEIDIRIRILKTRQNFYFYFILLLSLNTFILFSLTHETVILAFLIFRDSNSNIKEKKRLNKS